MRAINLRSAWELSDPDSDAPPGRVGLPLEWAAIPRPGGLPPPRARLVRRFGRPPRSAPDAPARLRLRGFAGLLAMEFNGAAIDGREEGGALVVELPNLLPRNVLAVVVDPARAAGSPDPWGSEAALEID